MWSRLRERWKGWDTLGVRASNDLQEGDGRCGSVIYQLSCATSFARGFRAGRGLPRAERAQGSERKRQR